MLIIQISYIQKKCSVCIQRHSVFNHKKRMAVTKIVYIYIATTFIVSNVYEVRSILPPSKTIDASEAPFMVYLRNRNQYCGGVILNEQLVRY